LVGCGVVGCGLWQKKGGFGDEGCSYLGGWSSPKYRMGVEVSGRKREDKRGWEAKVWYGDDSLL